MRPSSEGRVRVRRARPPRQPSPLVVALGALLALWWLGLGLGQTATYYADDLQLAPKAVQVSPGYLTLVEFYQEVDQISSGRPDLLHVEAAGAKIYVSALGRSGATDLVIEVGARTQLLHVQVGPGNSTRRYVVLLDKPAPPKPKPAARPSPPPNSTASPSQRGPGVTAYARPGFTGAARQFALGSYRADQGELAPLRALGSLRVPPGLQAQVCAPSGQRCTTYLPGAYRSLPDEAGVLEVAATPPAQAVTLTKAPAGGKTVAAPAWLSFRVIERNLSRSPDELTLYFALEHRGAAPLLVVGAADLRADVGGAALTTRVRQGADPATLRAGQTHLGTVTIRVSAAQRRAGPLHLRWRVSDPAQHTTYLVERNIDASTLSAARR